MRTLTSQEWERVRADPELMALRTDVAKARLRCQFDIGSKELYDDYHAVAKRFYDALIRLYGFALNRLRCPECNPYPEEAE